MSSKWPQTWTLIHSVMRRPQSDGSAAGCQDSPSTLSGSDRAQWEQTLGFKGDHCSWNEIVFPLQVFDCDESICSRFSSLLWNIYFQKETRGSEPRWNRRHMKRQHANKRALKLLEGPSSSLQTFNLFKRTTRTRHFCTTYCWNKNEDRILNKFCIHINLVINIVYTW